MLFYCAVGLEGEAMSNFPGFGAERYASPEREHRMEEIAFVREHRSALAKELTAIFKRVATITPSYRRWVATAGRNDGQPLPKSGVDAMFRD